MYFRSLFLMFFSVAGALTIGIAGWLVNFMWVISEPIVAKLFVVFCLALAVGLTWNVLKRLRTTQNVESVFEQDAKNQSKTSVIVLTSFPILAAMVAGTLIAIQLASNWSLPRYASDSQVAIPEGNSFVSFHVDGQLYVADVDSGKVSKWEPEVVEDIKDVTQGTFCLYHQLLVARDGKSFPVESRIDEKTPMTNMQVINTGTHFVWRILNAKPEDRNGLWMRTIENNSKPTRFSNWGWDPVWTRDGQTTYLCNGNGLFVIRDGNPTCVYESLPGFYVSEATLSPDDQWVAFRIQNRSNGLKRENRIAVIGPDGKMKQIYKAKTGTTVDKPQWSNDGQKIAFRVQGLSRDVRSLMVADKNGDSCQAILKLEPGSMLKAAGVQDFCWSPDDKRIAFVASLRGATQIINESGQLRHKFDLYVVDSDGANFRRITMLNQELRSYNSAPVVWW